MEPKISDTKMCKYGIFVAKIGKYGIFVAKIGKYGIFVAKIYKYALIDRFQGSPGSLDSAANCAALFFTRAVCHILGFWCQPKKDLSDTLYCSLNRDEMCRWSTYSQKHTPRNIFVSS